MWVVGSGDTFIFLYMYWGIFKWLLARTVITRVHASAANKQHWYGHHFIPGLMDKCVHALNDTAQHTCSYTTGND